MMQHDLDYMAVTGALDLPDKPRRRRWVPWVWGAAIVYGVVVNWLGVLGALWLMGVLR